ncbi:DUF6484 domain-containing protein [Paucibacter sp. R3-3]|uniref:DUF6484 domain-containing protein n=1 Tax=Roseateles agri TaxID=3098619 RepID=A0ABU5DAJ5_9BURK|nr:DUF6484 domain-containing protein [Paucibacter sp. R3-3]MDY0743285.1 DUF6484 domain-containing protein [Paucibacter sp. R3-3]
MNGTVANMKLHDDPFLVLGEAIAEAPRPPALGAPGGVMVARLQGFDPLGQPLLDELPLLPNQAVEARSTVRLSRNMVGRLVVVCFENADPRRPIVLGVVEPHPLHQTLAAAPLQTRVDGERHVIEADREIVLRCGDASITLTHAGKVLIQGTYILSRSKGYNKIKGAAIDIN